MRLFNSIQLNDFKPQENALSLDDIVILGYEFYFLDAWVPHSFMKQPIQSKCSPKHAKLAFKLLQSRWQFLIRNLPIDSKT